MNIRDPQVVLGQHAAYDVFVNLDIKDKGDLLGYTPTPEARVLPLHLDDGRHEFWRWSFRPWLATAFRREQQAVLALHERAVKGKER